jgi:RNA polymerase sigma-70 factor, ECF subfamily
VQKRRVGREVTLEAGGGPAANTPSPSAEAIAFEQTRAIQEALGRLPEDYRRVILLRYQEERSFEDIGRLLGLTPNAARKLWLRAVKRLQQESGVPHEAG